MMMMIDDEDDDDQLKGQCHGDLVLFQNSKNVFGLTETMK